MYWRISSTSSGQVGFFRRAAWMASNFRHVACTFSRGSDAMRLFNNCSFVSCWWSRNSLTFLQLTLKGVTAMMRGTSREMLSCCALQI